MDVKLPKLGEGAESGSVVSILVKEGDRIEKGQTLLELENEKAVAPIPSPVSGTVTKLRVKEGDKISVGHTLVVIDEGGGEKAAKPKAAPKAAAQQAATADEDDGEEETTDEAESTETDEEGEKTSEGVQPAAAPSVRKVARLLAIDLAKVKGSERGGRIVMGDLKAYVQRLQKLSARPAPGSGSVSAPAASPAPSVDYSKWGEILKKPMSPLRRTISRRMLENWNSIPHVTQFDDADVTDLMELRKKYAPAYEAQGTKLTLTPLVIKALVTALQKHPLLNSSLDETAQEIVLKQYFHIGLAVDTDHGLIVPVLRNADKKSVLELSKEVAAVAERARNRTVSSEELQGGTFTISNQGGIGGAHFTPIINKPEAAILGLGRGALKAAVRDGKVAARWMMPVAVSYDHRIIDGGSAARFMVDLVAALQDANEAMVKL